MDLHLHLSYAFRALDHKWGPPVDLDTTEDCSTSTPASVDHSFTTFSSEEYLRTKRQRRKRPTPYSRKRRGLGDDSLTNISVHRIPSLSDLGGSTSLLNTSDVSSMMDVSSSLSIDGGFVDVMEEQIVHMDISTMIEETTEESTRSSAPVLYEKKELNVGIFNKLKKIAVTLVAGKHRRQ